MKKKMKSIDVDHNLPGDEFSGRYGFNIKIDDLILSLKEVKNKGAENVYIDSEVIYGESYLIIEFNYERLETDDEYNFRLKEENAKADRIKERELSEHLRIKNKYKL